MIGINSRNGTCAGERKAKDFGETGHRGSGTHNHTGTGGACDAAFNFGPGFEVDVSGAAFGPVFSNIRAAAENFTAPVAAEHRTGGNVNRGNVHADGTHEQGGSGFVAAAQEDAAVGGIRAKKFLGFHGEEIAVHHRGGFLKCFAEREGGHFHGKTAGLPDAALNVFGALAEMAVAGIDVAPSVDD